MNTLQIITPVMLYCIVSLFGIYAISKAAYLLAPTNKPRRLYYLVPFIIGWFCIDFFPQQTIGQELRIMSGLLALKIVTLIIVGIIFLCAGAWPQKYNEIESEEKTQKSLFGFLFLLAFYSNYLFIDYFQNQLIAWALLSIQFIISFVAGMGLEHEFSKYKNALVNQSNWLKEIEDRIVKYLACYVVITSLLCILFTMNQNVDSSIQFYVLNMTSFFSTGLVIILLFARAFSKKPVHVMEMVK